MSKFRKDSVTPIFIRPDHDVHESLASSFSQDVHIIDSRLIECKAILKTFGINSLSELGVLNISGDVIPKIGLLRPSTPPITVSVNNVELVSGAKFNSTKKSFDKTTIQAKLLQAEPIPTFIEGLPSKEEDSQTSLMTRSEQIISDAYWAGTTIDIANDTNIIIQAPNKRLLIIAQTIKIGTNVTFTYERPVYSPQSQPPKPDQPVNSNSYGYQGLIGAKGNPGYAGIHAPSIEMWALLITGQLNVDLGGQAGHQGGKGGDGGRGGKGANGQDSVPKTFNCESGPFSGFQGGKGGKAGDGGDGGVGGNGGSFSLFAPQPIINSIATSGFVINLNPGSGGLPGGPGQPGEGGPGGYRGALTGYCANFPWKDRIDGALGAVGDTGSMGIQGAPGITPSGNLVYFNPISSIDFTNELLKPAILNFTKIINSTPTVVMHAIVGDIITLHGVNILPTDKVYVEGILAILMSTPTSTSISFTIPNISGGPRDVQVIQNDGTTSNLASLFINPTLTVPASIIRIRPGDTLTLKGTGFMPGTRVIVNSTQTLSPVNYLDKETISVTMVRPNGITRNSSGEPTDVVVSNDPNFPSNSLPIVLDTYKMICIGDSIMWGQGLEESSKFQTLVMNHVSIIKSGIGVYKENAAHSGAIIGNGSSNTSAPIYGEVPTSFPTIIKQHQYFESLPDAPFVDLVLMDGGINDLEIMTFLTPHVQLPDQSNHNTYIINQARKYCYDHMKVLLQDVSDTYPHARIIVTGYYAPVTANSFQNEPWVVAYLMALNIALSPAHLANGILTNVAKHSIINQSKLAATELNNNLQLAINEVNSTFPSTRIYFADPHFSDDNAVFADNTWLFALNHDLSLQDEVINERREVCDAIHEGGARSFCRKASCGHPNVAGAQAYFNAIQPFLV